MPTTNRELFGREAELAWLDACWRDGVHVVSIVAWGGVGKSALVNAWLAKLRDDGWRGAERVYAWSFYSQGTDRLSSSDEFMDAALRWFGDTEPAAVSPWDKGERLAKLVRRERTLLVLDGVEPLQWGPGVEEGKLKDPALEALVKELGAQNSGLCLIASRIALTDMEGLIGDKVQTKVLDHLSPEAGAELLKARGAKGADEELRSAAKEYNGHGLALTLLGSYLEVVAQGDILRRWEIGPIEGEARHGRHAQRVMAAYERWFNGGPEIGILRMLGLFDRPAGEDAIAALKERPSIPGLTEFFESEERRWYHTVTQFFTPVPTRRMSESDWVQAIAKLRRAGLLVAEQDNGLDAHPLVREHFGEQLRRERPEAWREGHRRLYEHLKNKAKEFPETIEEMAPLYAAVVHGCQAGKNQEVERDVHYQRIRRGNVYFSTQRLGAFGSDVAALSAFFETPWERLAPGLSELNAAVLLHNAGSGLRALGRLHEATGLLRRGLERHVAREDLLNATLSSINLSELLQLRGEVREAVTQARAGVDFADKSGDFFHGQLTRATLGATLHAIGLLKEANLQFEEAERMQTEQYPDSPLLYSAMNFRYCDILLDDGREAEVRERAERSCALRAPGDILLDIALDYLSLGRAHLDAAQRGADGDIVQATLNLKQAGEALRNAGYQEYIPLGLLARAALHTHTHAFADARHDLDQALTLATRCRFRLHEADAHLGHARLALAEGNPTAAREHLARATKIVNETGYHRRDNELAALERDLA